MVPARLRQTSGQLGSVSALAIAGALAFACGDDGTTGGGGAGASSDGGGGSDGDGGRAEVGGGGGSVEPQPGLYAEYFVGYYDVALERVEPTLDQNWVNDGPSEAVGVDHYSARWTGTLKAPETGTYTLITDADDGIRVWIDGTLVIDDWRGHFVTRNEATLDLDATRPVSIRVDYFEYDIEASARLSWRSATIPEQVIPVESLETLAEPTGAGPKPPYVNPVIPFDCPDPGVLATNDIDPDGFVAVCTGGSFPIRSSRSLVTWADTGAAILPGGKPAWANNGFRNWAPEIHQVGDHYVAYFTTVNGADVLSIGAASSESPLGPFADTGGPLVQHPSGVIDASFFEDTDGTRWLLYKIDGNSVGQATPIFIRQLAADGLSFAPNSSEVQILVNDGGTWEGGVVEAPWLVKRDGTYYLFYSGNVYDYRYRTGVARSSSLLGPYEKHGAPILQNNERWVGPGHGSVVRVNQRDYFVYHAWTNAGNGTQNGAAGRQVLVDRIDYVDGWPVIHDGSPSRSAQPWPGE